MYNDNNVQDYNKTKDKPEVSERQLKMWRQIRDYGNKHPCPEWVLREIAKIMGFPSEKWDQAKEGS